MRKVDTLEFLKLCEQINNTNFKPTDFEGFKSKPGENAFTISPKKWIELTNAVDDPRNTERADHRLMQAGYISITPDHLDMTDEAEKERLLFQGFDMDF